MVLPFLFLFITAAFARSTPPRTDYTTSVPRYFTWWNTPCDPELDGTIDTGHDAEYDAEYDADYATDEPLSNEFSDLTRRMIIMKSVITDQKQSHITNRFRTLSMANDAISGLNLNFGLRPLTGNLTNTTQLVNSYINLVKFIRLINLTRIMESSMVHCRLTFEEDMFDLIYSPYRGLMVILCVLSSEMNRLGISYNDIPSPLSITLPIASNNALKHSLTYYILTMLENSASDLITIFQSHI